MSMDQAIKFSKEIRLENNAITIHGFRIQERRPKDFRYLEEIT